MSNAAIVPAATTLYMKNIAKYFGSTRALKGVDLVIRPGEIHGLLGQNGCGKTTLIKVLAGYHAPEPGAELWLNGEPIRLPIGPGEFSKYGISFVHQDLGLIMDLSVLDNWTVSKVSLTNAAYIDWHEERKKAEEALGRYGLRLDLDMPLHSLPPVQRAMVAIIHAVEELRENRIVKEKKRGLLVLDEPTVFLPRTEIDVLFGLVRQIAAEGTSVMFVSHDIDEIIELTDNFTVLRDGLNVGGGTTCEVTKEDIIEIILGHRLQKYQRDLSCSTQAGGCQARFTASHIKGMIVDDVDFTVSEGEIVGITGVIGSGFEELPYLIIGAGEYQRGTICIDGESFDLKTLKPGMAIDHGASLLPADRAGAGGVGTLTLEANINMQVLRRFRPACLNLRGLRENAHRLIEQYEIRPGDPEIGFAQLSGGNAQKVILAKWVQESPGLLILHEPTQGVDVGARQQIYKHINRAATEGTAILCSSSDYEELAQICNRVIVFFGGKVVAELTGSQITKERIAVLCYQGGDAADEGEISQ